MPYGLDINHSRGSSDGKNELVGILRRVDPQWQASIRLFVVEDESMGWSVFFGEVTIGPEVELGPKLDLGRARVLAEVVAPQVLAERVEVAASKGKLTCDGTAISVARAEYFKSWSFRGQGSGENHSSWPHLLVESRAVGSIPHVPAPLVGLEQGHNVFFQYSHDVVGHITTFTRFFGHSDSRLQKISFVVEDHRARIADVCRVDEVLRVRLDGELDPGLTLVGQVRDSGGTLMRFDAPVEREMSVEGLGPTALEYGMAVVTPDQEIVDQRLGFIPASSPFEAARGEVGDVDLLQAVERMLDDGEDALCEYKAWVNPTSGNPKFDEIIRTVIAMSNSDGGTVLVGVDDAGVVTTAPGDVLGAIRSKVKANLPDGAEDDAEKIELEAIRLLGRKARDVIQQTVEPSVEVTPKPVQTPYGPILLLLVQRGQKPPYMHAKTKQFLVRRNATNRRANIEELRLLYLRRPGQ